MNNMTALVSCFSRAYHFRNNEEWIFQDDAAGLLMTDEEYQTISANMAEGITFFHPGFQGTAEEALRFIVDAQLSPSVLARSAFCERMLDNAVMLGCVQYVIFASGYDTFSLRNKNQTLSVYELDLPEMIADKRKRLSLAGFEKIDNTVFVPCDLSKGEWSRSLIESGFDERRSFFGSLLGISYYLKKEDFQALVQCISRLMCEGSALCFDYPTSEEGEECLKNEKLAQGANEQMQAKYAYEELEQMLSDCGLLIYEHHDADSMTTEYFEKYSRGNPQHRMKAPAGVNYCLAIKQREG